MQHSPNQIDNQSDNDQGFIPSKIIIKQKKCISTKKSSNYTLNNKKQFIPRYIFQGIMRKEPSECYKRFSKFDYLGSQILKVNANLEENTPLNLQSSKQIQSGRQLEDKSKNKNKEKILTPYDKFVASAEYLIIYSRYKDYFFSNQEKNFAKNQVKLDCLKSNQQFKYKQVKSFEIIQQKCQEVITPNIYRNGSIRQVLLKFDSRFQCGNLLSAFKSKKQSYKYYLFIQNDTNSNGYNQWFYFSLKHAQIGIKYQFKIMNFRKRNSFFKEGNMPVVFSLKDSKDKQKSGYSKRGDNITYGKSPITNSYENKQKYFQLSFQLQFFNQDDIYYISMGLPYSYTKLMKNLSIYEENAKLNGIDWKMSSIGTSIAGNQVPCVTITKNQGQQYNFKNSQSDIIKNNIQQFEGSHLSQIKINNVIGNKYEKKQKEKKKKIIFIIGRQHPGQTWSSYLIDQLLYGISNIKSEQISYILQNYIIKCIPMINIDGVIHGNFRCDLSGMDLNRNWKNPSTILHPQIYSIKNQLINLVNNQGYKVQCCFDLHGHSKQYNVFCYGCKTDNIQSRILPYIFSQINKQFYFPYCTFGISKYKQSTARAVIFDIIKNTNVLTIQSSFFASKIQGKVKIFQPKNFQQLALMIFKGCKHYLSQDDKYNICKQNIKSKLNQFLAYKDNQQNAVSGSDSQPSGDQMEIKQRFQKILPKNLIKQCIQTQKNNKQPKRHRNLKRQTLQPPVQKSSFKNKKVANSQHQNRTIDVIKQDISLPTKNLLSKFQKISKKKQIIENTISFFNKKSNQVILTPETIDQNQLSATNRKLYFKQLLQKGDKKLPFFTRQKQQMAPMKLKNQSFQFFKDVYNATQKHIKHDQSTMDDIKNQRRNTSKKLGIYKQTIIDRDQQFPLLCVLSQNKKKTHVQKIKEKKQRPSRNQSKGQYMSQKIKTAIQTRTQAIKNLREKNKNSMQLVSKIWRQNFTRYGMAFSTFKISK